MNTHAMRRLAAQRPPYDAAIEASEKSTPQRMRLSAPGPRNDIRRATGHGHARAGCLAQPFSVTEPGQPI